MKNSFKIALAVLTILSSSFSHAGALSKGIKAAEEVKLYFSKAFMEEHYWASNKLSKIFQTQVELNVDKKLAKRTLKILESDLPDQKKKDLMDALTKAKSEYITKTLTRKKAPSPDDLRAEQSDILNKYAALIDGNRPSAKVTASSTQTKRKTTVGSR